MIMVLLMTRRLNAFSILISIILAKELSRNLWPAKIKMMVMMLTMMVLSIKDGRGVHFKTAGQSQGKNDT